MTDKEQKKAAKAFAEAWKGKGDEKQDTHRFWIGFLQKVLGLDNADEHIMFEKPVKYSGHTTYIDAYIPETRVLIEQKSIGLDLDKKEPRHGEMLTPFEQAVQYSQKLKLSDKARYIIVSNFETFRIHDLDKDGFESTYDEIKLCDLEKECHRFGFMIDKDKQVLQREMEISQKAGILVGELYDAIRKQYDDPDSKETLRSLNILCVRLVFCLYAEDAGIFGIHEMFGQYLSKFPVKEVNVRLQELFEILDQKKEDRYRFISKELAAFPYVNGGLFSEKDIEIPPFTDEIVDLLINKASAGFDWSEISPTIFGAMFESTLNPDTRRTGGMHYTSIENIHKVIDPLFLTELNEEFDALEKEYQVIFKELQDLLDKYLGQNKRKFAGKTAKVREHDEIIKKLEAFRDKLASLTFFDPACGSGNFLTETYLSLRRLENKVLKIITNGSMILNAEGEFNPIKVNISQFYGIEINDFAVKVAQTALWIAESQMLYETEDIIGQTIDFLPLKSYTNIVEGNALRIDWGSVVPKDKLSYIMGNPPFVGYTYQSKNQKTDLENAVNIGAKNIDYVVGWYYLAAKLIQNTEIKVAFVSTNSISQGEQVSIVWKSLFENYNIHIDFAHRTFRWDSEASLKAHVHCVIIGFSLVENRNDKLLFDNEAVFIANNINAYLVPTENIFIEKRTKPISDVPLMCKGSQPTDGGNFILTAEEKDAFIKSYPEIEPYIKRYMGADEFINNRFRYCFWLKNINPSVLRKCKPLLERIDKVRECREASPKQATKEWAKQPTLFTEDRQPESNYIIVPSVSSEQRQYVPIGFVTSDNVASNLVLIIPNAELYHFGILTSTAHMAWMRVICGRLEMRYRYSNTIVYNNFPWCTPTDEQKAKIEQTAQAILDARALYPDCSLADLYDETTMPPELRKAHQANDKAVMQAYGFAPDMPESEIVAELMKMYQRLTEG